MKKLRKNKKFVMGASVALTALMLAAATFAWFTASDSVNNEFSTGGIPKDSVKIWEIFEKPEEWKPGQEVNKDVGIANLGTEAVFVRASFKETITKMKANGADLAVVQLDAPSTDAKYVAIPTTDYSTAEGWEEASTKGYTVNPALPAGVKLYMKDVTDTTNSTAKQKWAYAAVYTDTDGKNSLVSGDFVLTDTTIAASNVKFEYYEKDAVKSFDWTALPTDPAKVTTVSGADALISLKYHDNMATTPTANKWFFNAADGWFYYVGPVEGGTTTPYFLDSVTLDKTADNTYQYLDYSLVVNSQGIQATADALTDWKIDSTNPTLYNALTATLQ